MRSHRIGTISEAVANAVEAVPSRTHRQIASFLGISPATLSYGMDPSEDRPAGLGVAYVDRLADRWPEAARPIAEHFAHRAGGVFVAINSNAPGQELWQHAASVAKESGEAVAALSGLPHGGCRIKTRRELVEAREMLDAAIRDLDAQPTPIKGRGAA